jgi:hypothetical protein
MPFKHRCTAHAFFPERLSNHCQGLRHTFSEICTKSDAIPLSDASQNHARPNTRLQIKGRKKICTSTQMCKILYTDSHDTIVLSSTVATCYYNCFKDGSTYPGNYGYPPHICPNSFIISFITISSLQNCFFPSGFTNKILKASLSQLHNILIFLFIPVILILFCKHIQRHKGHTQCIHLLERNTV